MIFGCLLRKPAQQCLNSILFNSTSTLCNFDVLSSTLQLQLQPGFQQFRFAHRLPPNEVTNILRKHECSEDVNFGSIKSFETSQLNSNSPIEDARSEARCLLTTGHLFGVFDGHGGTACGQVVAKRLFNYIAASLLPKQILRNANNRQLLEYYNDKFDLVSDLSQLYDKSLQDFISYLYTNTARYNKSFAIDDDDSTEDVSFDMDPALQQAFLRLDEDISNEAQVHDRSISDKTLSVAMTGAVCIVAHIDSEHLHIASTGDCRAVLGVREDDDWYAKPLNTEHNAENLNEVTRILSEHPPAEKAKIITQERLFSQLAPLRAFGDFKFKWDQDTMKKLVVPLFGESVLLPNSLTPPYLTARPDILYHKLRPKDSFLILATDGLWDFLSPNEAVQLVGEHMSGKTVLSPYVVPKDAHPTLGELNETLAKRRESKRLIPIDSNAATHLIRHALGGTEYGLDTKKLSLLLSLPTNQSRGIRDDITITVIFFDSDYLSQRPL